MSTTAKRVTGVREAKAGLSRLLRDVRRGHEWTITERGAPIAKLVPVSNATLTLAERVRGLEEAGTLEPRVARARRLPPPLPVEVGLAQRLLQDERGWR